MILAHVKLVRGKISEKSGTLHGRNQPFFKLNLVNRNLKFYLSNSVASRKEFVIFAHSEVPYSGYVVPKTGELIVTKPSWFNYETVIESFRHLVESYPVPEESRVYLVLDNAPWHKKAVRLVQTEALPEYQDIRDRMTLIFLPPYSPDLNPIEQVWRITRREVTHNRYFPNAQALESTLDGYFATHRQPNRKLANLCSFKHNN